MTTLNEHKLIISELIEDINEKIRSDLLLDRQKIVGFATSEAATNIFAYLLHKLSLISPGHNVNHNTFASIKRAEDKYQFDFKSKDEILKLMVKQEDYRNKLCYERQKTKEVVERAVKNLFVIKKKIEEIIGEEL